MIRIFAAALLASASLASSALAQSQQKPLKLGVILDMSGPYADITGPGSVAATKLAIEDAGGEVLGRKIELLSADHLNKADIAFAREQSQLGFVVEEMRREYQLEPTSIDWRRELWFAGDPLPDRLRVPGDDEEDGPEAQPAQQQERPEPTDAQLAALEDTDWPPLADEIAALRARIQSMGSVNLDAIAEYASLKGRHEFLRTQSDDLWKAKEQLVNAIDEIKAIADHIVPDNNSDALAHVIFDWIPKL